MDIREVPAGHPDARRLVAEVQQHYVRLYGGEDAAPFDDEAFDGVDGAFFVGYDGDEAVATGCWRRTADEVLGSSDVAEVKRMYVVPSRRRRGLARAMLTHLEATAAAAGYDVLVLETGSPQTDAIELYTSAGYAPVSGFGHYQGVPEARAFARRLAGPDATDWDAEAERFDDEPDHGLRDPAVRAAWRRLLLGVLPPAPAGVADLGCGTGSLALLLATEGHVVTGLDLSPAMVERARAKADAAGVQVELVVGDAARPPLPERGVDVVLVRHVLWAMADPVDALRRWAGLLVPGGRLVLVEGRWHTGAGLSAEQTAHLLSRAGLQAEVRPLPDPALWGGETGDERYLVLARDIP